MNYVVGVALQKSTDESQRFNDLKDSVSVLQSILNYLDLRNIKNLTKENAFIDRKQAECNTESLFVYVSYQLEELALRSTLRKVVYDEAQIDLFRHFSAIIAVLLYLKSDSSRLTSLGLITNTVLNTFRKSSDNLFNAL
jgi:hypothetical protein